MSTRAQIRFATRGDGVSFSEHPDKIHAQFFRHTDGYPEGLGLDIAYSIVNNTSPDGRTWEIEELQALHGDLEYIYYIWQAYDKSTWISIFAGFGNGDDFECIFVGTPEKLLTKYGSQLDESHYKLNTNDDG